MSGKFSLFNKTATVKAKIDPELKKESERIFEELGLTTNEAIRLFFKQVKLHNGLPFPLKVPPGVIRRDSGQAQTRQEPDESARPAEPSEPG